MLRIIVLIVSFALSTVNLVKGMIDIKQEEISEYIEPVESVTGYSYEPWHYKYIGRSNALLMKNNGMILEEYLRVLTNG